MSKVSTNLEKRLPSDERFKILILPLLPIREEKRNSSFTTKFAVFPVNSLSTSKINAVRDSEKS